MLLALGWDSFLNNYSTLIIWFLSQITLGQAYNPELFRSVGVGVVNGSLWTITTEILFYLSVPILVWLEKRFRFALFVLTGSSFLIYATGPFWLNGTVYRNKSVFDLMALTPIVWGWMFGLGILAVKYFHKVNKLLSYAPFMLLPLVVMIFYGEGVFFSASSNRLGLFYFICYAALILWFSFCLPTVRLSFDFSYGAYIWHMPIINFLFVLALPSFSMSIALTIIAAALSWFLVEKPMLKLKHQSLRPV